jgi:hypothetical protein
MSLPPPVLKLSVSEQENAVKRLLQFQEASLKNQFHLPDCTFCIKQGTKPPNKAVNICMEEECKQFEENRYFCQDCNDDNCHNHMPITVVDQVTYRMKKWYNFLDDLNATLQ